MASRRSLSAAARRHADRGRADGAGHVHGTRVRGKKQIQPPDDGQGFDINAVPESEGIGVAGTAYGEGKLSYLRKGGYGAPTRTLLEWVRSRVA